MNRAVSCASLAVLAVSAVLGAGSLSGCASGRPVSSEAGRYLTFRDVKGAIKTATEDGLARPWREQFRSAAAGREPIVLLYRIKNNSDARDITETMLGNEIEQEFVNSGVGVITERSEIVKSAREGKADDEYTDPAFVKRIKTEHTADFFLTFTLDGVRDASEKGYQITFELISLETTRKVWIKTYDIVK